MKNKHILTISLIVGFIALAFLATQYYKKKSYEIVSPKKDTIIEAIYGLGTVKTDHLFEFKAGTIQHLQKLYVKEGDQVQRGTALFQFSTGPIQRSPINGTVTAIPFNETENIPAQQVVIQVQDFENTYIEVSLEQEGALRVKKGHPAQIQFESLRAETYTGQVSALYARGGEFIVRIDVSALNKNILPGMTADVSIEIGRKKNVLLVPLAAINAGQITRRRHGQTAKIIISIGHNDQIWAEVTKGDIQLTDEILIPRLKKQR